MNDRAPDVSLPTDANASGRSFDDTELSLLRDVLASGTLNCTRGTLVASLEREVAHGLGVPYCRATTSGTAAIHAALAAIDPEPGDEVITTPITDMGAIAPILFQTAIPVFADVDPVSCNVTAETIARKITRRTRAVVATHLFGNPCALGRILELCAARGIPVIEDAAQAWGATWEGRPAGTLGTIGCFSLQQGKHITSGEGGLVVTADPGLARRIRLFTDKAWGYGDPQPDHTFLALNYRMTELQGAVALAQWRRLPAMLARRVAMAQRLTAALEGIAGVAPPRTTPGATHSYWRYALRVDPAVLRGGADALGSRLAAQGVACAPRYIQKLAFECAVLRERRTFGRSQFPFRGTGREDELELQYDRRDTPGAAAALAGVVVLPWNERFTEAHVDFVAGCVRSAARELAS